MSFKLDFSEIEELGNTFENMKYTFDDFLKDFLIELGHRIIARTKKRTPVDTGALRRAWILGDVHGSGKNIEVEILNGMEYATDIEYGHRIMGGVENKTEVGWYNGRFMLKTSIDEIRMEMPKRYESAFKRYCERKGFKW